MTLHDKVILVTGGTSGIGRELVRLLAGRNQTIVVLGRDSARLARIKSEFANVFTYTCCLTDARQIEKMMSTITDLHPDLSVVVNNAAVQHTPTLLSPEFSFDTIDQELSINLAAPIKTSALLIQHFVKADQPAAFVNISSGLALFPKTTSAVYCATKAGLHSFSRSLRYQLSGSNVRVFEAILPLVDTGMSDGRGRGKLSPTQAAQAIIKGIEQDIDENYIGKARLIRGLARISPRAMANIMKRG